MPRLKKLKSSPKKPTKSKEIEIETPEELKLHLMKLKSHPGYKFLVMNIEHWKNQCLNEILKEKDSEKAKGEFTAYGRVLNAIDAFIQLQDIKGQNINLDPHEY